MSGFLSTKARWVIGLVLCAVLLLSLFSAPTSFVGRSKHVFDKSRYSVDDAASIWAVVNKGRTIGNYVPDDLVFPEVPLRLPGSEEMKMRQEAAAALKSMFGGAEKDGIHLMLASAYRSNEFQQNLYEHYLSTLGQDETDATSARPGHSEHQTGLAADIEPQSRQCEVEQCFGELNEGKWVARHAYKYGYIVRYPQGKRQLTGYDYEPWHIRYVGKELAAELRKTGQTM